MREHSHHDDQFDAGLLGWTRECAINVPPKLPVGSGIAQLNYALAEYSKDGLISIQDAHGIRRDMDALTDQEYEEYGFDLLLLGIHVENTLRRFSESTEAGKDLPPLPAGHRDAYTHGTAMSELHPEDQALFRNGVNKVE